ncbi:hypothetical protein PQX77_012570 [Marasmius sp. AFHP31]|nr:hypothetical protein PQX77_012570 [Marasmius sp. AFHP31]
MPNYLYQHFCQLVSATRVVLQRRKSLDELREARRNLCEFVVLFEEYYYQRKLDRLHFVRPCIHALLHIIKELIRVGSLTEVSQWTTERTIATYERRMRLHSNPYGNLGVEIAEQAGTNAIYAMEPSLRVVLETSTPSLSLDVGSGYTSLHPRDDHLMDSEVIPAYKVFCEACEWEDIAESLTPESPPMVRHFARIRLPNGQVARSKWQESKREGEEVRQARNVKILLGYETRLAEVQYYFNLTRHNVRHAIAAVKLFSLPDEQILKDSLAVLHVCEEGDGITFVSAKWITEVVAMVPFQRPGVAWDDNAKVNEFFRVEKTFLNAVEVDDEDGSN